MTMKTKHIMKKTHSAFPSRARLLPSCVAAAMLSLSAGAYAQTQQFAATPLYLQNKSDTSGQPSVKHNIMFLIDDSGSMEDDIYGNPTSDKSKQRIGITKNALSKVLDKYRDQFNWSLQTLHNNGKSDIESFTDNWQEMQQRVGRILPKSGTPTTRRYYETVSRVVMPAVQWRCQKSYVILMSDGDANTSCNYENQGVDPAVVRRSNFKYDNDSYYSSYYGARIPSATTEAYRYFGPSKIAEYNRRNNVHPDGFVLAPGNYHGDDKGFRCVPRTPLTGGPSVPYWDTNSFDYYEPKSQPGGIAFFSHTLSNKDFKTGGLDKAGKSWDGDPGDPKGSAFEHYAKQTVQTFTVGFGSGISPTGKQYLQKGASRPDWYYTADEPDKLLDAFQSITDMISSDSQNAKVENYGTTAPALASSREVPNSSAVVHLNTGSWSSQIRFYPLERGRTVGSLYNQPSFANRKTMINTGSGIYMLEDVVKGKKGSELNNEFFGITATDTANPDRAKLEWREALLPWVGRTMADEEIQKRAQDWSFSQPYRVRPLTNEDGTPNDQRNLGDILDGSVGFIGPNSNRDGNQMFMVAAANDGMVHIFRDSTVPRDTPLGQGHPYILRLSYLPAGMEREDSAGNPSTLAKTLKDMANEQYGDGTHPHRYGVNGGFVLRHADLPYGNRKNMQFMFGSMGQGGRGAYALNLSGISENDMVKHVPLFETAKGSDNKLGYTMGTPQIGRVSIKRNTTPVNIDSDIRYAGFLASGYRNQDIGHEGNETALYVYDLLGKEVGNGSNQGREVGSAGTLLAKISVPGGRGGLSEPALVDTDFDGLVDVAYAGDRGGNMYRFDLRGETPNSWKVSKIFSGNGDTRPITSAPAISRRSTNSYVVIFGTGSDIYQSDLTSQNPQAIYGVYDNVDRDTDRVSDAESLQSKQMTREDNRIYLDNSPVPNEKNGWKIELAPGERVTVKPTMILRTAVITIRNYNQTITNSRSSSADQCMPESSVVKTTATTTFLGVKADTGGALDARDVRFTPDTFIRRDAVTGKNYYANGLTREGVLNFTFLNPDRKDNVASTLDGDVGGSGSDRALTQSPKTPNNRCFVSKNERSLLLSNTDSLEVQGRFCGLRRISWREIFF